MTDFTESIRIRPANINDATTIASFNCRLASETESKTLDAETVEQGVRALLQAPARGRYFVAETGEQIVGQLMHTFEWSDWRNGDIWWIQSVYVHSDFRRQGVFRALSRHLEELARETPGVVGIRLYVERENGRAQQTYSSLGFEQPGYLVMERLFGREKTGERVTSR
ncbi:MAG: GNAT family N-acetyltransferase [Planctomycetota bacterium]|jgi:ribosomal protein S18 acetylase RimI-like enzyme